LGNLSKAGKGEGLGEYMARRSNDRVNIAVVVLTINQRDSTLRCLASLQAIDNPPFHTVLWDNGSQDGTAEAVQEAFPGVLVHHHPTNLGVASGRNAAAKLAIATCNPTHLLFLDNDMLVEPDFVGALSGPFSEDDRVGQTQAKLRFMQDRERLNDGGGCAHQLFALASHPGRLWGS
jgi:GT2 family glycosyltransferase